MSSEASKHVKCDNPHHSTNLDKVKILEVELTWFERRVREAIRIRNNNPKLNKDAGRYNLPSV